MKIFKKTILFFLLLCGCFSVMHAQNMERYIRMKTGGNDTVRVRMVALTDGTPVRMESVSQTDTQRVDLVVDGKKSDEIVFICRNSPEVTIYGDVIKMYCSDNDLISLDVSGNVSLQVLSCTNNRITSLDLSKNIKLRELYCNHNALSVLDVGDNTGLLVLECSHNALSVLDVGSLSDLLNLFCSHNALTALDVSGNIYLTYLKCSHNALTSLDVGMLNNLFRLECSHNALATLDVRQNSKLAIMDCSNNSLATLDLSRNSKLVNVDCNSNFLSALEIGRCAQMQVLDCRFNRLTSLDLTRAVTLQALYCNDNCFTTFLDVSENRDLVLLQCWNNPFTTLSYDIMMCALVARTGRGGFYPLYDKADSNAVRFMAANANIARDKNWNVQYGVDQEEIPATNGSFDCETIGVREAAAPMLRIYPNPAHTVLYVSGMKGERVQLCDMTGRLLMQVETNGEETLPLDISGLARGIYVVRCGSRVARFVKE